MKVKTLSKKFLAILLLFVSLVCLCLGGINLPFAKAESYTDAFTKEEIRSKTYTLERNSKRTLFYFDVFEKSLSSSGQTPEYYYDGIVNRFSLYESSLSPYKSSDKDIRTYNFTLYRTPAMNTNSSLDSGEGGCFSLLNLNLKLSNKKVVVSFENPSKDDSFGVNVPFFKVEDEKGYILDSELGWLEMKGDFNEYKFTFTYDKDNNFDEFDIFRFWDEESHLFRYFDIDFKSNSPVNSYFWYFKYQIKKYDGQGTYSPAYCPKGKWWGQKYDKYKTTSSACWSEADSVYSLAKEKIGKSLTDYTFISRQEQTGLRNLYDIRVLKNVSFSYLKEIPGTPFAYKETVKCDVSEVVDTTVYLKVFADVLGVDNFKVFNTYPVDVDVNVSEQKFEVKYPSAVSFNAKANDGKNLTVFMSLGESFNSFYSNLLMEKKNIIEGVTSETLYEFVFQQFINPWEKQLSAFEKESSFKLGYDTLYGYWGYVAVPQSNMDLNSQWETVFGAKTTSYGLSKLYKVEGQLSKQSYLTLRDEFGYSYMENLWQSVWESTGVTKLSANHYFFYADGTSNLVYLGENGAKSYDDNNTLVANDVKEGALTVYNGVKNGAKNIWGGLSSVQKVITILALAVVVTLFGGVAVLIIRRRR